MNNTEHKPNEEKNKERRYWNVSVTLPTEWKEKIKKTVHKKGYISIADYVRDLIREDLDKSGLLENNK